MTLLRFSIFSALLLLAQLSLAGPVRPPQIVVDQNGNGDYTTISAALANVPATGAQILVKRGTYNESVTISTAKTRLVGEGAKLTTLVTPVNQNGININADDVEVSNLEINGSSAYIGVAIYGARDIVRDCYVHNTRSHGIQIQNADARVENNLIENVATSTSGTAGGVYKGIFTNGAGRPKIINNRITGWSQGVGLWYGTADGLVEGNYVINNYGFEDAGHTVYRSAMEDYGANVAGHGNNRWMNNVVDGSTHNCFEIAQGVAGSQYVGNVTRNPGKLSNDGSYFEVTGQSGQLTTDILISGNYSISDGTRRENAVVVNGSAFRIMVRGNTYVNFTNTTGVIFLGGLATSGDISIDGNQFFNSRTIIRLNNNSNGVVISNNLGRGLLPGGSLTWIEIDTGGNHVIHGNSLSGTGYGLFVGGNGINRITGNSITTSTNSYCVNLASSDNVFTDNQCSGTGNQGASVVRFNGSRNIVRTNDVDSGGMGGSRAVYFDGGDYNIFQDNTLAGIGYIDSRFGGPHNTLEPNHNIAVTKTSTLKSLGSVAVGASQIAVQHGLGYAPSVVTITMTSPGNIYKSAPSDANYIYLTADADGRTAEIYAR
jgi:hypothetical protein